MSASIYDIPVKRLSGEDSSLGAFKGEVVLVVNVASKCGLTPQYAGLEKLYEKYLDQGLVIVGVPANNFGAQEPGTNEEIKTFCTRKYNVSFPMLAKVSVKGEDITPLYQYLTAAEGGDVKWNFTKFLIGKNGKVAGRFEPAVTPEAPELSAAIERELK